jgi:hypothetical protein
MCYDCNSSINTNPPFANVDDIKGILARTCEDCMEIVAPGTASSAFCAAFGGSTPECCDMLWVFEGANVWASNDCSTWLLVSSGGDSVDQYLVERLVEEKDVSGLADFTFENIPAGEYLHIELNLVPSATSGGGIIKPEFNDDTVVGNYRSFYYQHDADGTEQFGTSTGQNFAHAVVASQYNANLMNNITGYIYNHATNKDLLFTTFGRKDANYTPTLPRLREQWGWWADTSILTKIKLLFFDATVAGVGSVAKLYVAELKNVAEV